MDETADLIADAMRFKALQAERAAQHAVGCSADESMRDATKSHYQMLAYRMAAGMIDGMKSSPSRPPFIYSEVEASARAWRKHYQATQ